MEVGTALAAIRDDHLFRREFDTFGAYCRDRWGWNSSRSRQLISAAEVVGKLASVTMVTLPSERQARELVPLKNHPATMQEVVMEAAENSKRTGKPVTAVALKEAVRAKIAGMAAQSRSEIEDATRSWDDKTRARFSTEMMSQRGELTRLVRDIGGLPDPVQYAVVHSRELSENFLAEMEKAISWLELFAEQCRREVQ